MHPKKRGKLLKKGWSDQDLQTAEALLEKTEKKDIYFSKITFWSALIVIIVANLLVAFILVPFLIVLTNWLLYIIAAVLAATIGFLYSFLLIDIKHLSKSHHISAGIIVPILALVNLVAISLISNQITQDIQIQNTHNPYIVGTVFAVFFILPYIIDRILGKHHFYQEK